MLSRLNSLILNRSSTDGRRGEAQPQENRMWSSINILGQNALGFLRSMGVGMLHPNMRRAIEGVRRVAGDTREVVANGAEALRQVRGIVSDVADVWGPLRALFPRAQQRAIMNQPLIEENIDDIEEMPLVVPQPATVALRDNIVARVEQGEVVAQRLVNATGRVARGIRNVRENPIPYEALLALFLSAGGPVSAMFFKILGALANPASQMGAVIVLMTMFLHMAQTTRGNSETAVRRLPQEIPIPLEAAGQDQEIIEAINELQRVRMSIASVEGEEGKDGWESITLLSIENIGDWELVNIMEEIAQVLESNPPHK